MPPAIPQDRPSDFIRGLVCGYANPIRDGVKLLMLRAYVDDSHMGQAPVYVLAGWVAPAEVWARFSDAWRDVLWMSPRIEYFKYAEAMNCRGEFLGMSETRRDEKVRLLLQVIEDHSLFGISSLIPSSTYDIVRPYVKNPYIHSFFGIIVGLTRHYKSLGIEDKIEFVFDYQPGSDQMRQVQEGWEAFKSIAPPEYKNYLFDHPPTFQSDNVVLALQAADFHAGWLHRQTADTILDVETGKPLWGSIGDKIQRVYWIMQPQHAEEIKQRAIADGVKPAP